MESDIRISYLAKKIVPLLLALFVFTSYLSKYWGYICSGLLAFIYIIFSLRKIKKLPFKFNIFFTIIFFLMMLISAAYAVYPATAKKTFIATLCCLFFGFFVFKYGDEKLYKKIFNIILLFSFVFSSVTIFSIFFPSIYRNFIYLFFPTKISKEILRFLTRNTSAGLANQTGTNAWFSVLGLGISFSIYNEKHRTKYLTLVFIFIVSIFFTAKRAHLLFSLFSIFVIYGYINRKKINKIIIVIFVFIFSILFLVFLFPNVFEQFLERFNTSNGKDISSGRLKLWKTSFKFIKERPILGWGWGYYSNKVGTNVHNVYLQVLCELGLIGELLFVMMLITNIKQSLKNLRYISCTKFKSYSIFNAFIQLFIIFYCFTGNCMNDLFILIIYMYTVFLGEKIKKCIYLN